MRSRPRISSPKTGSSPVAGSHLRLIRGSAPAPRLELPRADARAPWWDGPAVGWAVVVSMLVGVVLIAMALGWIK